ncbi:MAG: hypothetical protein JJE36_06040 [Coriobacteriia bacterium]|nr:hypothetical protein [Coriobacteriia bacterium]
MSKIKQGSVAIHPEDTIGYCIICNKLVRRTKKAKCANGHEAVAMQGAQILDKNEEIPVLPKFHWGAFFMAPVWGPAYGVWAGAIIFPLWLVADSVIRSAVYGVGPRSTVFAKVMTYGSAVLISVVTVGLMAWMGWRGWGSAWRSVYRTGASKKTFAQFKKTQYVWSALAACMFVCLIAGAVYYWINILPAQMAALR